MISSTRRLRFAAPSLALALAAGFVGALTVPAAADTTTSFGQSTKLFVGGPDNGYENGSPFAVPNVGPAVNYPSSITVDHHGPITDIDVKLYGISHSYPDDLDVMLVGPGGQQVTLMSDAGSGFDLIDKDLRFSDSYPALPDTTEITETEYRPTEWSTDTDAFPAPAPESNHNTSLAAFNGLDAAGTWRLYVRDDSGGDGGSINGWGLSIDQGSSSYPSTVDVSGLPAISDVDVRLTGVTSDYPDDLSLLLVAPGGQQATIMSEAGGSTEVVDVDLVLDDEAGTPLPEAAALTTGRFKPANYHGGAMEFPAPAPTSSGWSSLSAFDGKVPNGVWSLYSLDDGADDRVAIDGWSLDFTWAETVKPSGTVVIAGGAATTSTQAVDLDLSATDPAPSSGVTQMRFSNDGSTFSAYQPYAASAAWTLGAGAGTKTVFAQFKDKDGNESPAISDTIALVVATTPPADTSAPTVRGTTPKNKAKNVRAAATIKIAVSEALQPGTVTKRTVYLKVKGGTAKIPAKVSWNAKTRSIVVNPTKSLKRRTKYVLTVTTKVSDLAGNGFDAAASKAGAQPLTTSFTTA